MRGALPRLREQQGAAAPLPAPLPPPMHMAKRLRLEDKGFGGTVSTGATGGSLLPPPGTPLAGNPRAAVPPRSYASLAAVPQPPWAPPPSLLPGMIPVHPPPAAASPPPAAHPGPPTSARPGGGASPRAGSTPARPARDGRTSGLSAEEKVVRLLERFPHSFCQELQVG